MAKILLIETDIRYAEFCRKQLSAAGHHVALSGGRLALDAAAEFEPDAVMLAISLPGSPLNGLEIMERILARSPNTLIILNSKYEAYRDDFRTWAADAFVTKSWDLTELLAAIQAALKQRDEKHAPSDSDQYSFAY